MRGATPVAQHTVFTDAMQPPFEPTMPVLTAPASSRVIIGTPCSGSASYSFPQRFTPTLALPRLRGKVAAPPATAWAEGAQVNGRPFPATASAEGRQFNGAPSLRRHCRAGGEPVCHSWGLI